MELNVHCTVPVLPADDVISRNAFMFKLNRKMFNACELFAKVMVVSFGKYNDYGVVCIVDELCALCSRLKHVAKVTIIF